MGIFSEATTVDLRKRIDEHEAKFADDPDRFQDFTLGDAWGQAASDESLLWMASERGLGSHSIELDNTINEDFSLGTPEWQDKINRLSDSSKSYFYGFGSRNEEHAEAAYRKAYDHNEREAYLNSHGAWEQFGMRGSAVLIDAVPALLASFATGGGSTATWAGRLGKLIQSSFGKRFLAGATVSGLAEVGRMKLSIEERDALDLIIATGIGGIAHGAFSKSTDVAQVEAGNRLITNAVNVLKEGGTLAETGDLLSKYKADWATQGNGVDQFVENLQMNLASLVNKSESETFADLGSQLFFKRTLMGEEVDTLENMKEVLESRLYNTATAELRPLIAEIGKDSKRTKWYSLGGHLNPKLKRDITNIMGEMQMKKTTSEHASRIDIVNLGAMRLQEVFGYTAKEATDIAEKLLKAAENMSYKSHDILAEGGSKSFAKGPNDTAPRIPQTNDYMPLQVSRHKMNEMVARYGEEEVKKLLAKSIKNAIKKRGGTYKKGTTQAIAKVLFNKMMGKHEAPMLTKMDHDDFLNMMKENLTDAERASLDDQTLNFISSMFSTGKTVGKEGSKFEQTRGLFDYTTRHTIGNNVEMSWDDLIETDFDMAWQPYFRTQSGYNVLEKLGLDTQTKIGKKRAQIETELREKGVSSGKMKAELARFDEIINELQGRPLMQDPFSGLNQGVRIVNNMGIARLLGSAGFSMAAEANNMVWTTGIKHMFNKVGVFKQLVKMFKTGKLEDGVLQEIHDVFGLMGELNRGVGHTRFEPDYNVLDPGKGTKADWMEEKSNIFKELTLLAGGIKPLTALFEGITTTGVLNNVRKAAEATAKGKKISSKIEAQLTDMGLVGDVRKNVFDNILKHSTATKSKGWGKEVKQLNTDNWDPEALHKLVVGTRTYVHTIIQKSSLGDKVGFVGPSGKLMEHTVLGKLATSLKNYVITSWAKQLQRGIANRKDLHHLGMLTSQMAVVSLVAMAQIYARYPNDRKKREELITPENIAAITFGRSTPASFLPQLYDTGAELVENFTGKDAKLFQHSRSSGLSNSWVSLDRNIPGLDTVKAAMKFPSAVRALLGDDSVSAGDMKRGLSILPGQNVLGIDAFFRSLVEDQREANKIHRRRSRLYDYR